MQHIRNKADQERALDILEQGFRSSPGIVWMIRRNNTSRSLRTFLSVFIGEASLRDGAWLTSDRNGVVLFYHQHNTKSSFGNFSRKLYTILFVTGIRNGIRGLLYQRKIRAIRPKEGWVGMLVATERDSHGIGAAWEIKQEMFRIADAANEPIFVETTVPRVLLLYKAAGYTEYHAIPHPYEDLTIWFLRRDPQTQLQKQAV